MFGQIVVGPPGSGKSTYCNGMLQFLSAVGRKCCIVNLDPAAEYQSYSSCALDIRDLASSEKIMRENNLGPNGALLYALECIDGATLDRFINTVANLNKAGNYLIFDCPGQVELFTHQHSLFRIFHKLVSKFDARLCVVSLVDSIYLTSASQYISITLLCLRSMLQLGLPQVNVISKIDKLKEYGSLALPLDFYAAGEDLHLLNPYIALESKSQLGRNFTRLTELVGEVVENFGLIRYDVLSIEDKSSMINLLEKIDKSNGYVFGTNEIGGDTVWQEAVHNGRRIGDEPTLQERWIDQKEHFDGLQYK
ncbi:hypothetical protein FT663_03168 [Candidozyma haemuli var. vulneris]|uniref:GPN-loop GTPase 2 n=1 Tax=Candidozyma haemuli TaxID=45357 RepID=A0A2V1B144_9ASCO|nr:hypothetical protein CXQ85_003961 [[Candida] haemuloni]KAF3985023.1 hypothetical protein FT662_05400 [[Candida] haemuloni var. vulneris]KAF3990503.1 hypothetical protein FT663_03168 [[Candida] haemuloni var. vulneris]PVH23669.1 hypothetical protein CXQ85_003961 [[Candida] haemuloni]